MDGVARVAHATAATRTLFDDLLRGEVARVRAAALDDEAGDVAMELQAIVVALLGKLDEVAHVDGGIVAGELHADSSLGGGEDGDFVAVRLVFGGVQRHKAAPLRFLDPQGGLSGCASGQMIAYEPVFYQYAANMMQKPQCSQTKAKPEDTRVRHREMGEAARAK